MLRSKSLLTILLLSSLMVLLAEASLFAKEEVGAEQQQTGKKNLDDMVVVGKKESKPLVVTPSATTINLEEYKTPGTPQNALDILKDQAIIDFRGESDLVPGYDDVYMKGFDGNRFTVARDGMTIDSGGSSGANVLNFGTLSLGQIETIEIIPGPHSALYGGKSEGGVINLKTKIPERYTTLKPGGKVSTSYKSYNTQNYSIDLNGGADSFFYGISYQYYSTDGYLRNNEAEINNFSTRLGYLLPSDGYISFDLAYSDTYQKQSVINHKGNSDYDSDYPESTASRNAAWQEPDIDEEQYTYRLN